MFFEYFVHTLLELYALENKSTLKALNINSKGAELYFMVHKRI